MQEAILRNFRKVVTPEFISESARKAKFNHRVTSKISGLNFVHMLIMQINSGRDVSYSNLNSVLNTINRHICISNQALSEYFYKESSVIFIKSIYEKVFSFQKELLCTQSRLVIDQKTLNMFNRIFIEDSTFCTLHKSLASKYKGNGGGNHSGLKIDLVHELKTGAIVKLSVAPGNISDIHLGSLFLEELCCNDLILRDLGYFNLNDMQKIENYNAYFISRLKYKVNVYLNEHDADPIDLGRYLGKQCRDLSTPLDTLVFLGDRKQKIRLIAYKVSAEVANERRRKAQYVARDKGRRSISEGQLNLCDYVILVTNIPATKIPAEVIGTIYRIRWSIELIFKTWKSQFRLQVNLRGHKATRIECIVYATLITCLLTTVVYGWLKRINGPEAREISLDKLSKWLLNKQGYCRLIWGDPSKLAQEMQAELKTIRVQKRTRKTTLERVVNMEAYSEKYGVNF
ncbi:MAG TPA: IS4 family transposase [Chlamydiales bacterium]|nr:IS4 family transposase [Chlamydiales bacterium]